jgi:hypothetical protein
VQQKGAEVVIAGGAKTEITTHFVQKPLTASGISADRKTEHTRAPVLKLKTFLKKGAALISRAPINKYTTLLHVQFQPNGR